MLKVTVDEIAAATRTPVRTVRERFERWRKAGGPVTRRQTGGRGQPPWEAPLDAYCARVGLPLDAALEALGHRAAA